MPPTLTESTPSTTWTRSIWGVTMILPLCAIFAILDLAVSLIMDHSQFIAVYYFKMTVAFSALTIIYSFLLFVGVHAQKWNAKEGLDSESPPSAPSVCKPCFSHWTALCGGCVLGIGWAATCIAVLVNSIASAEETPHMKERGTIWAVGAPCATIAALEIVCVGYVVWEGFKVTREPAVLEVIRVGRVEEKPVYRLYFGPSVQSMKSEGRSGVV